MVNPVALLSLMPPPVPLEGEVHKSEVLFVRMEFVLPLPKAWTLWVCCWRLQPSFLWFDVEGWLLKQNNKHEQIFTSYDFVYPYFFSASFLLLNIANSTSVCWVLMWRTHSCGVSKRLRISFMRINHFMLFLWTLLTYCRYRTGDKRDLRYFLVAETNKQKCR